MKTIMIVEDEKSIRDELKTLLETSGYKVILLERFDNTLEDILKSKFDLLLLDINLPKMNGETLLKEFRKQSNIPVIMVTSRVGRMIMFRECLYNDIMPFYIEDRNKDFYIRGIKEYQLHNEKGYLIDTCLNSQDNYERMARYFLDES